MYYKPMGDLPYISSEQGGGLIIRTEFLCIYEYTIYYYIYKRPIPIQKLKGEEAGGLIIRTIRYMYMQLARLNSVTGILTCTRTVCRVPPGFSERWLLHVHM